MKIALGQLRNAEVKRSIDDSIVTIEINEMNGSYYGSKTEIEIPARSYELLEQAVVENWLESKK